MANVVRFCAECLQAGGTPVLLGYSLGKSQEVLCALTRAGLRPMLHPTIFKMTEIYRALQPGFPCEYEKYEANEVAGKVLICPPSASRTAMLAGIKNRRTAVLTGWAIEPGAKYRYGCDEAFPLSDHADYGELLRYVGLVKPKRVLTLHGFASEFAGDLRRRGVEAWALTGENQLELQLGDTGLDRG
jgi:Cft2 family RNA processing exonuclease